MDDDIKPDIKTHELSMRIILYKSLLAKKCGKKIKKIRDDKLNEAIALYPNSQNLLLKIHNAKKRKEFMKEYNTKIDPTNIKNEIEIMEKMLEERHLEYKNKHNEKRKEETKICVCCSKDVNKSNWASHTKSQAHIKQLQQPI